MSIAKGIGLMAKGAAVTGAAAAKTAGKLAALNVPLGTLLGLYLAPKLWKKQKYAARGSVWRQLEAAAIKAWRRSHRLAEKRLPVGMVVPPTLAGAYLGRKIMGKKYSLEGVKRSAKYLGKEIAEAALIKAPLAGLATWFWIKLLGKIPDVQVDTEEIGRKPLGAYMAMMDTIEKYGATFSPAFLKELQQRLSQAINRTALRSARALLLFTLGYVAGIRSRKYILPDQRIYVEPPREYSLPAALKLGWKYLGPAVNLAEAGYLTKSLVKRERWFPQEQYQLGTALRFLKSPKFLSTWSKVGKHAGTAANVLFAGQMISEFMPRKRPQYYPQQYSWNKAWKIKITPNREQR